MDESEDGKRAELLRRLRARRGLPLPGPRPPARDWAEAAGPQGTGRRRLLGGAGGGRGAAGSAGGGMLLKALAAGGAGAAGGGPLLQRLRGAQAGAGGAGADRPLLRGLLARRLGALPAAGRPAAQGSADAVVPTQSGVMREGPDASPGANPGPGPNEGPDTEKDGSRG